MPPKKTTQKKEKKIITEEPHRKEQEIVLDDKKVDKVAVAGSQRVFLIHFEKLKEETVSVLTQEKKDSLKDSEFSGATPIVAAKLAFDLLFNEIVNESIVCVFSLQEKIEGKKKLFHYRGERIKKETGEYINIVKSHAPSPSTRSEESKEVKEPTEKIVEEKETITKNIKKSNDESKEVTQHEPKTANRNQKKNPKQNKSEPLPPTKEKDSQKTSAKSTSIKTTSKSKK
jgi:hypothetical protein